MVFITSHKTGHDDIATGSGHGIAKYWKTTLVFYALQQQKNIDADTHHCKEGLPGLVVLAAAMCIFFGVSFFLTAIFFLSFFLTAIFFLSVD
jgi:hypothetical protein